MLHNRESKAILLIDMDGPLCDWYGSLYEKYKAKYPNRPIVEKKDVTQFYVEELYPPEHRKDVVALTRHVGFYENLKPQPRAIEALKDIENNCLTHIEPFICSSPDADAENLACHSEKARWVKKNLGSFWVKRLILTKDKTLVHGDFLIDDKPEITGVMTPSWLHLVYSMPHNQGSAGIQFDWTDWPSCKEAFLKY